MLTTLLDPLLDPAKTLICLYHERWEEELTFDEIKTHQRERPVLRSQIPAGVIQEIYGLLLGHYVIRVLMHQAAEIRQIDPERISFTATLKILRCRLPQVPQNQSHQDREAWYRELVQEVAEEVLSPRRHRINPRVIKVKMSKDSANNNFPNSGSSGYQVGSEKMRTDGLGETQIRDAISDRLYARD